MSDRPGVRLRPFSDAPQNHRKNPRSGGVFCCPENGSTGPRGSSAGASKSDKTTDLTADGETGSATPGTGHSAGRERRPPPYWTPRPLPHRTLLFFYYAQGGRRLSPPQTPAFLPPRAADCTRFRRGQDTRPPLRTGRPDGLMARTARWLSLPTVLPMRLTPGTEREPSSSLTRSASDSPSSPVLQALFPGEPHIPGTTKDVRSDPGRTGPRV